MDNERVRDSNRRRLKCSVDNATFHEVSSIVALSTGFYPEMTEIVPTTEHDRHMRILR